MISTLIGSFMLLYRRRRAKQTISASTVTKKHLQFTYCCYIQWCFLSLSLCAVLELWGWWNYANVVHHVTELTVSSIILAACSNTQEILLLSQSILFIALSSQQKCNARVIWRTRTQRHLIGHSACPSRRVTDLWATTVEVLGLFFSQWLSSPDCIHKWL